MEYMIRKKNNIDTQISKFGSSKEPLDVYTVSSRGCTCPAAWRRRTCKHTKETKIKIEKERPKRVEYAYRINTYKSANEPEEMPWNIEWPRVQTKN